MKFQGGYNVTVGGRPSMQVDVLDEPDVLYLPLASRRFRFTEIQVDDGAQAVPGQTLARDPANHNVPLLAPRAGTVRLDEVEGHIVLDDVTKVPEEPYDPADDAEHAARSLDSAGMKRYKLLALGAWQFFEDAHTGRLPDPFGVPQAVIISTVRFEPHLARGDVQIRKRLRSFTRGLEHLQSLLEYQPIYLVVPDIESPLAREIREHVRGYAWIQVVTIPPVYPFGHMGLLARKLGLKAGAGPVWGTRPEGVLAVDRALTLSRPSTVEIVSLGGLGVEKPRHLKAIAGYPLDRLLQGVQAEGHRVLVGGALTGTPLAPEVKGLDAECVGLTVLPEPTERKLLGFVRPGFGDRSYSQCFVPVGGRGGKVTTALRGERRACIACGLCEKVCPMGLMPQVIHRALYQEDIDGADRAGVDLSITCGLCSYVCPSKIELRQQILDAQATLRQEREAEEVEA